MLWPVLRLHLGYKGCSVLWSVLLLSLEEAVRLLLKAGGSLVRLYLFLANLARLMFSFQACKEDGQISGTKVLGFLALLVCQY